MSDTIDCAIHGPGVPYGFVCCHLTPGGDGRGWNTLDTESADLCPDAWCDGCEGLRQGAGGTWTDDATEAADIQVVCATCYHRSRGARLDPGLDLASLDALVHGATARMQARNDALRDGLTGDWWFDLDDAVLEIRADDAVFRYRAAAVGSFDEASGTWLAAFANGHVPAISGARSATLAGFAEARGLDDLAAPRVACDLTDAWGRAAIGASLLDAVALYRCPVDNLHLFFALLAVDA